MPFREPAIVPARVFTRMPDEFRRKRRNAWTDANRGGREIDSFLEGPSFDRDGNLWVVDVPFGRVFRIAPSGDWTLVTEYDGSPNGLKIHRDGRVFLADYRNGLMIVDPASGRTALALEGQIAVAEGLTSAAADLFQAAVHKLSAAGADQGAAQLWFDLAEMLTGVGLADAASDAYRRAAASTGLRARMSAPVIKPEHAPVI